MRTLRSIIRRSALLADAYRLLTDFRRLRSRPKSTPHGFLLAGDVGQTTQAFERKEVQILEKNFRHCDLFVDVGANIGFYTCLAAKNAVPSIVAIEPHPTNVKLLHRNLAINGYGRGIDVIPIAVGESRGLAELRGTGTGASLIPGWAGISTRKLISVPVESLDELLAEGINTTIRTIIKLDVEGFEEHVLQGASTILQSSNVHMWLVEINPREHHPRGSHPKFINVLNHFWQSGYSVRTLEGDEVDAKKAQRWLSEESSNAPHNFICLNQNWGPDQAETARRGLARTGGASNLAWGSP